VCIGASPIFVPYPTTRRTKPARSQGLDRPLPCSSRAPNRRLSSPEAPWSAAYATKSEPRSASAIPTDPIMRYFHAASSERALWLK
jgi:hypothetical protein